MKRQFVAGLMLAAAVALGGTGCSDRASSPLAPTVEPRADFQGWGHYSLLRHADHPYKQTGSAWVGSWGGMVLVDDNLLVVPPVAVKQYTKFTLTVSTQPYLSSELTAVTASGQSITQFPKPLYLVMSYRYVEASLGDPTKLVMLWVVNGPNGQLVPQATTVNTRSKTITAKITHFSEYSPGLDPANCNDCN